MSPSNASLGEVLQAGQHQEPLARALTDHGRKVGDGGDVGDLVECEQRRRPASPVAGPDVGGISHVAHDGYDEGRELPLAPTG